MEKETHILLSDLVEVILFTLQAEGRAKRTYEYYRKLFIPFLQFASEQNWPKHADSITTLHIRQFLTWIGTRTVSYIAGRGCKRVIQSRPSVAWPYYKVIRHLYNWAIEEHLVTLNPTSTIHFKAPAPAPVLAYSVDEIKAIITVCEHDIVGASRFLGLRIRHSSCFLLIQV
jgi:site-specific recombinase XerD